jgi:transcriptional regulator of acetoin/glycerol metabolism
MALHHSVVLAGEREVVDVEDLPDTLQPGATSLGSKVRRVVDDVMGRALDSYGGNVSEAARRLGVSRSTLYRRGLTPTDRRRER